MAGNTVRINNSDNVELNWYVGDSVMDELIEWLNTHGLKEQKGWVFEKDSSAPEPEREALGNDSDADTTLAIAEKLGLCACEEPVRTHSVHLTLYTDALCGRCGLTHRPDWLNNLSAAMGLLDEYSYWLISKGPNEYVCNIYLNPEGPYEVGINHFFAHSKDSKTRAITLACAKAMGIEIEEEQ